MNPSRFFDGLYISFWIPAAVLTAALAIKLPSIIKLWKDPLLRAVGGLLVLACGVFVFAAMRRPSPGRTASPAYRTSRRPWSTA